MAGGLSRAGPGRRLPPRRPLPKRPRAPLRPRHRGSGSTGRRWSRWLGRAPRHPRARRQAHLRRPDRARRLHPPSRRRGGIGIMRWRRRRRAPARARLPGTKGRKACGASSSITGRRQRGRPRAPPRQRVRRTSAGERQPRRPRPPAHPRRPRRRRPPRPSPRRWRPRRLPHLRQCRPSRPRQRRSLYRCRRAGG